jgi:prevent-host-death family protein
MSDVVNVHEAKTHLSRLLERVEAGESITIARAGTPIADLVPHSRQRLTLGALQGGLRYDDETFDEPDPDAVALFEGA